MKAYAYDYGEIRSRIRAVVVDAYGEYEERHHSRLYHKLKIERSQWKLKWEGKLKFQYEEIDRLARHFDAPRGWPFVDWQYADALRDAWKRLGPQPTGPPPPNPDPVSP